MPMPALMPKKDVMKVKSTELSVDFPGQNEVIRSTEYAIRISAPENVKRVEIAINQGDWQACRKAVGYWWYDWSGYEDGEHEVIARLEMDGGRYTSSAAREFFVDL